MSAESQRTIDAQNQEFWDEVCGSGLARSLGIAQITPESVAQFDAAYRATTRTSSAIWTTCRWRGATCSRSASGSERSPVLAERGARYRGVDIAAGPVAMMQDRLRWLGQPDDRPAVEASALALPWEDEAFDVVVSIGCLHHTGDLSGAIGQVHRVLRPGGLAFVMLYDAHSFRQLTRVPRERLRALRSGRGGAEQVRAMYDVNTAGAAAPHGIPFRAVKSAVCSAPSRRSRSTPRTSTA